MTLNVVCDEYGLEYQVDDNGVIALGNEDEDVAALKQNHKNSEN